MSKKLAINTYTLYTINNLLIDTYNIDFLPKLYV